MFTECLRDERAQCVLEGLWYCKRSSLTNVWTEIRCTFLDRKNYQTTYHWNLDTTQDTQRHGANKWAGVSKVLLESVDGEQGEIGFMFGIAQEVDIYKLSDLEVL